MKPKKLYEYTNRNQGFYSLTVIETEKSIIITEYTNHTGHYDKEIRYHKTKQITEDIQNLITGNVNLSWFIENYTQRDNNSYWQKWQKIH